MHAYRLITFTAADRPGLVESLAEVVAAHGGNWLESRMSNLAGRFAGIVRVAVALEQAAALEQALAALQAEGVYVHLEATGRAAAQAQAVPFRLEIVGHDRPGIVREFAAALADRGINVFDMRTDISSAPMSADPLFSASAGIHVPAAIDLEELRDSLEAIADELMIQYTLAAMER
jgi:glycine cleavage system regulatory protein